MTPDQADYIVVGAGAAGSTIAARLSDSGASVVLLEAGGGDRSLSVRVPGLSFMAVSNRDWNWFFRTEASPELGDREQVFLAGKLMGGSSSINGMVYSRGHSQEYDAWAAMGCTGWSFDDVLPFFRKSEDNERGASRWHGAGGPLPVRRSRTLSPIYDRFLHAAADEGIGTVDDLCADVAQGFGYYDVNVRAGRRVSAAEAFLKPRSNSPNLTVLRDAHVRRVVLENGRAVAVEVQVGGETRRIGANREIIVSAGGVRSPHLLMLSGIGPGEELAAAGIPLLVDSPAVGRNLQNHPTYLMTYAVNEPLSYYRYLRPRGAIAAAAHYLMKGGGVLGESAFGIGGFFRSDPDLAIGDIQVIASAGLMVRSTAPRPRFWQLLPKRHGFSVVVYQGTPHSRGAVTLRSGDPDDAPRVRSGYFTDPRDMDVVVKGIQRMRAVCAQPEIASIIAEELTPGSRSLDRAAIERDVREHIGTSHHQCGTCAMGGDASSVVDPTLKVRGVAGLRVADASVIPVMPNASLHAPTIMIGEKAADMILRDAA